MKLLKHDREIDRLVAEKVLGWEDTKAIDNGSDELSVMGYHENDWKSIPNFSTSIEAAWSIVERLKEQGLEMRLEHHNAYYTVELWKDESVFNVYKNVKTAPMAICLASLKAATVSI